MSMPKIHARRVNWFLGLSPLWFLNCSKTVMTGNGWVSRICRCLFGRLWVVGEGVALETDVMHSAASFSQTHQGATFSHAVLVFLIFVFRGVATAFQCFTQHCQKIQCKPSDNSLDSNEAPSGYIC